MHGEISIPRERLEEFCHRWKIIELRVFGSALSHDFRPDSDLDLLVKFAPEADWSLMDHVAMEEELTGLAGRKVDLVSQRDRAELKLDPAQGHPGERGAIFCLAMKYGVLRRAGVSLHRCPPTVLMSNSDMTRNLSPLATRSSTSKLGALIPRSVRLRKSTLMPPFRKFLRREFPPLSAEGRHPWG